MGLFECCHICPSTKRHLGCHSHCEKYAEQLRLNQERKEARRREFLVYKPKTDYLNRPVWHKYKR